MEKLIEYRKRIMKLIEHEVVTDTTDILVAPDLVAEISLVWDDEDPICIDFISTEAYADYCGYDRKEMAEFKRTHRLKDMERWMYEKIKLGI